MWYVNFLEGSVMKKKIFIKNTSILTGTSCINRVLGLGFRIYLTHIVGAVGIGLYQLVSVGYSFAVVLTASGLSFAVTRIVSVYHAKKSISESQQVVKVCTILGVFIGIVVGICMFSLSPILSKYVFQNYRIELSLRILSLSLPFLAISACMRGYFYASKNIFAVASEQILEQIIEILVFSAIVAIYKVRLPEYICASVVIGTVLAEMISCLYSYLFFYRRMRLKSSNNSILRKSILKEVVSISVPMTLSSCLNNCLSVFENISIPRGLHQYGLDLDRSLGDYGKLTGMVYPIISFPASVLLSVALLIIPELSALYALRDYKTIQRIVRKLVFVSLTFSIFIAGLLFLCADWVGFAFYKNDCGMYIRILAPIIPIIYVDVILSGILKGINKQLQLMSYDFLNAIIRVILTLMLVPIFGIKGEIVIIFVSAIMMLTLNSIQLIKFMNSLIKDL